ncbi:plasmid mobilization protein [Nibrella viscosa]
MEKKHYRGGAPQKPEQEKRDRFVQVRFRHDEYKELEKLKSKTATPNMSTFIRFVCLEKPLPMKTETETYQDVALSLMREMRNDLLRIGVNINQSSRRINSTTDYHDLQREVSAITTRIQEMEAQFRQMMSAVCGTNHSINQPVYDYQD